MKPILVHSCQVNFKQYKKSQSVANEMDHQFVILLAGNQLVSMLIRQHQQLVIMLYTTRVNLIGTCNISLPSTQFDFIQCQDLLTLGRNVVLAIILGMIIFITCIVNDLIINKENKGSCINTVPHKIPNLDNRFIPSFSRCLICCLFF